jgi:16S rRNA G966 N2-methylase RsmD
LNWSSTKNILSTSQQLLFDETELDAAAAPFRPIHYLGSKLRVLDGICDLIDEVCPPSGTVCDLFAGSGTTSLALSRKHPVIAVDIQEYSRVICSALLTAPPPTEADADDVIQAAQQTPLYERLTWALDPLLKLEDRHLKEAAVGQPSGLYDLIEHGSIVSEQLGQSTAERSDLSDALRLAVGRLQKKELDESADTTVSRYFGGVYYSYRQGIALDCVLQAVHSTTSPSRDRFLAAALGAASDTVNTVGRQFAQPIRPRSAGGDPKKHLIQKALRDRALDVRDAFENWVRRYQALPGQPPARCSVHRMDFREALMSPMLDFDVVYADPPYTRDHYSRYYHALETMCLRDNPPISTAVIGGRTVLSRGLYREERHQSPFCIKSQALDAFRSLFSAARERRVPLVLSYSPFSEENGERPRVTSMDAIRQLAKAFFRSVEIDSPGYIAHSKLTSADMTVNTQSEAEKVFICKP